MTKETKDRIAREAIRGAAEYTKHVISVMRRKACEDGYEQGYIAGAEKEAERAQPLLDHLTKIRDHLPENDVIRIRLTEILTTYNSKKG